MNKTIKLALLAGAIGSVVFGGYVAIQRHRNNQSPDIPTEIVEEQVQTIIEKQPEPKLDQIPKAEIEKITDDSDASQ